MDNFLFQLEVKSMEFEPALLKKIGKMVTNALRQKLKKNGGLDTGELRRSIKAEIVGDEIHIYMLPYGKYLEYGTPPHFPPPKALEGWVGRKWGAKDDKERVRFSWILARHIAKFGTKPYPFIRETMKFNLPDIIQISLDNQKVRAETSNGNPISSFFEKFFRWFYK